jgi:hypothetical protein
VSIAVTKGRVVRYNPWLRRAAGDTKGRLQMFSLIQGLGAGKLVLGLVTLSAGGAVATQAVVTVTTSAQAAVSGETPAATNLVETQLELQGADGSGVELQERVQTRECAADQMAAPSGDPKCDETQTQTQTQTRDGANGANGADGANGAGNGQGGPNTDPGQGAGNGGSPDEAGSGTQARDQDRAQDGTCEATCDQRQNQTQTQDQTQSQGRDQSQDRDRDQTQDQTQSQDRDQAQDCNQIQAQDGTGSGR